MKKIFPNWSFSRILYLAAGLLFILVAVKDRMWFMIPVGLYFVAMGIFKLGCASGSCATFPKENTKTPN